MTPYGDQKCYFHLKINIIILKSKTTIVEDIYSPHTSFRATCPLFSVGDIDKCRTHIQQENQGLDGVSSK